MASDRDRLRKLNDLLRIENAQLDGKLQGLQQFLSRTVEEKGITTIGITHHNQEIESNSIETLKQFQKKVTWADNLEVPEEPEPDRVPIPTSSTQKLYCMSPPPNRKTFENNFDEMEIDSNFMESSKNEISEVEMIDTFKDDSKIKDYNDIIQNSNLETNENNILHINKSKDLVGNREIHKFRDPLYKAVFLHSKDTMSKFQVYNDEDSNHNNQKVQEFNNRENEINSEVLNQVSMNKSNINFSKFNENALQKDSFTSFTTEKPTTPKLFQAPESPIPVQRPKNRPRRASRNVIYKELSINRKLRRGDNFTFGIPKSDIKNIYKKV